jgi:hypothetical protein
VAVCAHIKPSGDRCRAQPMRGEQWCYVHHPDFSEKRAEASRRGGKRGGRGRPQAELANIKERLADLAEEVLAGEVDKGVAAVASQILNVYIRAVIAELIRAVIAELQVREQLELVGRLEALEEALERGNRWGA